MAASAGRSASSQLERTIMGNILRSIFGGKYAAGHAATHLIAGEQRRSYALPVLEALRHLINGQPFVPFTIHISGGQPVRVPTEDHIAISPTGGRLVVFDDDGLATHIFPMLISQIVADSASATA